MCRTPALGGHLYECADCGNVRYQYFSCGHSQCPICQGIKRQQWQDRLSSRLLNIPYCHITFTMPHELNGLSRRYPKAMYNILFRSSWQTIKEVCESDKNVGGLPGMSAVLHTWGSDLKYHVHVHSLVSFGGLSLQNKGVWCWPKHKHKLASFRLLSRCFRKNFLKALKLLMNQNQLDYHLTYQELTQDLQRKRWVVNHQRPTADTDVLTAYLGRYICRIGISHHRLSYDKSSGEVRIEYNNYRLQEAGKAAPKAYKYFSALSAIHQILQHQLPPWFQRSRHYGLHAGASYKKHQVNLPSEVKRNGLTVRTLIQILKALLKKEAWVCSVCQSTNYHIFALVANMQWLFTNANIRLPNRSPPISLTPDQQAYSF
jgi:hypothetical protein